HRRRTNAIQPAAPVQVARGGERGAGELFRVQAVRDLLRRVAADRQAAWNRLARELVAETGLVAAGCHANASDVFLQYAAFHLVAFDRLEQGLEIALSEALVALALDDLEEDRPDAVLGEDLQQQLLLRLHVGIDEDLVAREPRHVLAVVGYAFVDEFE